MNHPKTPMNYEELKDKKWLHIWHKKARNGYIIGPLRIGKLPWLMNFGVYLNRSHKPGFNTEREKNFLNTGFTSYTVEGCLEEVCFSIWGYSRGIVSKLP